MILEDLQTERRIGRIPVRNLWLLMLYASDLTRFTGAFQAMTDQDIDDLPDLIARLLAEAVQRRLRRNLTRGYHHREAPLTRVRGRIDMLATESRQLLSRGEIFCRFEELTVDMPRNRLVRAALDLMTRLVQSRDLVEKCRSLASTLARSGVGGPCPSRADMARDQIGRNDSADHFLVALAELAFDLVLPTEEPGQKSLVAPEREETWVRHLFEKAILGFCRVELQSLGWGVRGSVPLEWQLTSASPGLADILPRMQTDIMIDHPGGGRLVIDTKFTSILAKGWFRDASLKSGYIYQMYAYLRSQEGGDACWNGAAGLFIHPAIGDRVREQMVIQSHQITFVTVDLARSPAEIRKELRTILLEAFDDQLQGTPHGRLTAMGLSKSLRVDGISVRLRMENGHLFVYVSPVMAKPQSEEDQSAIYEYCDTH